MQGALWSFISNNHRCADSRCMSTVGTQRVVFEGFKSGRRTYSTGQSDDAPSLFDGSADPWKEMLSDVDEKPPTLPARNVLRSTTSAPRAARRQTMTQSEANQFDVMFQTIFDVVLQHQAKSAVDKATHSQQTHSSRRKDPLSGAGIGVGIGHDNHLSSGEAAINILTQLRRNSKNVKRAGGEEELFERMREQIELCETDQELLAWAARHVYNEGNPQEQGQAPKSVGASSSTSRNVPPLPMQSRAYALTVAFLMRTFRDRHHDPHLALTLFQHTKRMSVASYVFGCTVPVYNELITTRWQSFRDLRGVMEAMEEMRVNGVEPDKGTRKFVEELRRELGADGVWNNEDKGVDMWRMLRRIEFLSVKSTLAKGTKRTQRRGSRHSDNFREDWKLDGKDSTEPSTTTDGSWRFGEWST